MGRCGCDVHILVSIDAGLQRIPKMSDAIETQFKLIGVQAHFLYSRDPVWINFHYDRDIVR